MEQTLKRPLIATENRAERRRRRYLHDSGTCAFHGLQVKRGTDRCMRCRKRGSRVVAHAGGTP